MTPAALNDFLNQRPRLARDPAVIAAALGPARANATIPKSKSFRVLTLRFDDGRRTSSEVVIALGDEKGNDPYNVLSWQDDVEAGRRPRKLASD